MTLLALERLLGAERVERDPALLARHARSDTAHAAVPIAVVRPRSRDELSEIVRAADRAGIRLYPISRGENWGYGAAAPVCPDQVLLDLGELRAIEVDEELACAVIEPGVTQLELAAHLAEHHPTLMMDCTGAPGDTSIIGNVLERGVGFMPGGRAANATGMEIVTANGERIQLGFGAYGAEQLGRCRKATLGPDLEGLFLQSNLAIVSRLGIWLRRRPEVIQTYWLAVESRPALIELLIRFQDLQLAGGWSSVARGGQLASELYDLGGAVYGSRAHTDAFVAELGALSKGLAQAVFIEASGDWQSRAARELAVVSARLRSGSSWKRALGPAAGLTARIFSRRARRRPLFQMLSRRVSVMSGRPLPAGAHPPRALADAELDEQHRYSQLWLAPACPLTSANADRCLTTIHAVLAKHGVEFFKNETPLLGSIEWIVTDPRSLIVLCSLGYRRGGEAEPRALACYDELWDELAAQGYISYRSGIQGMHKLRAGAPAYWDLVNAVKRALDPHSTIAPGRYDPDGALGGPFAVKRPPDT